MTIVTTRPTSTVTGGGWAVTGASAHAALSDDSDATFITAASGDTTVQLGFPAPTIPATGRLISVAVAARAKNTGSGAATFTTFLTGVPGTWTTTLNLTPITAIRTAQIATTSSGTSTVAFIPKGHTGSLTVVMYEAYVYWTYVAVPTLTVDAPTGVQTSNHPTVSWTPTLDTDGGTQTFYEVKVFDTATFSGAGFSPDSSTADDSSGIVEGGDTFWQGSVALVDDTYRAYVRVAQTVNGAQHWSAWALGNFSVNALQPSAPTLAFSSDNANGRVAIAITDATGGEAGALGYEIEHSFDGGTTWESVRGDTESLWSTTGEATVPTPSIVSTSSYQDTADGTTHSLTLPTTPILANDLILIQVAFDGNPTISWPADWTEIKDEAGNGSLVRAGVAWKRAVGGEEGAAIPVTTSASEGGGALVHVIRNASTSTAPEVSTGVSAATANANPDALNPANWGTENTLWIPAVALDGGIDVTAAPTNYFDLQVSRWNNASGATIATAWRRAVTASEDPGAFTNAAEDSRAWTVGIRPENGNLTNVAYDYEATNGLTMNYRVRAFARVASTTFLDITFDRTYSAWATGTGSWSSTSDYWLKHPTNPALNEVVIPQSQPALTKGSRSVVLFPLGRTDPVVVSDTRTTATGEWALVVDTAQTDDIDALLDDVSPLLMQAPAAAEWADAWLAISDHTRARAVDKSWGDVYIDSLPFVIVARPAGALE